MKSIFEIQQLTDDEFLQEYSKQSQKGSAHLALWFQEAVRREKISLITVLRALTGKLET